MLLVREGAVDGFGKGNRKGGGNYEVRAYSDASHGGFSIRIPHRGNTIGFLVKKDDVGDSADFGAFVTDVLFDVENCSGVFL